MLEDRTRQDSHVRDAGGQIHHQVLNIKMNEVRGAGTARCVAEIDSKIGQTKMREKETDKINEVHYVNKKASKKSR